MPVAMAVGWLPSSESAMLRGAAADAGDCAAAVKRLRGAEVEMAAPASAASFRKSLRVVGLKACSMRGEMWLAWCRLAIIGF
jgi:hypothetical protein